MSVNCGGKFIVFEGCDGVGKSTQVKLLAEKLSDLGQKVCVTREPGGTEAGEKIRDLLKETRKIDPICEVLLMFAARRDHFVKLILPKIQDGYFVICDRFYYSSLVYQGILKQVSVGDIMRLKQMTVGDFEPDLTIILDLDVDISIERVKMRCNFDEYDEMSRIRYSTVREGFCKVSAAFPFCTTLINADGSPGAVFSKILKTIRQHLNVSV
ncbi:MAG: dTMP kinase [Holosporaceae bacterium]|jgi:dTMP kinase|nr:dTMP kinase [Holosporaceae bacterium]